MSGKLGGDEYVWDTCRVRIWRLSFKKPKLIQWRRVVKHRRQRAYHGYSMQDWWTFDTYVTGLIANACRDFRTNGIGYPTGMEPAEWLDILERIEGPLRSYSEDKFSPTETYVSSKRRYDEARDAMRLFAEHLGSFWD